MNETPLPLYYKVYNKIKTQINNDEYKKGEKLPTEKELCDICNVSRLTVRRALDELQREGLIDRKKGKGTFFTGKKREEKLSGLSSFTDEAIKEGDNTSSIVLENKLVTVEPEFIDVFDLPKEAKVVMLKRIRYLNDEAYAIETAYLNPSADLRVLNIIEHDMAKESLYKILKEEFELKLSHAEETLEITALEKEEAEYLRQEKNSPAALRSRYTYLEDGSCIEHVKSVYRGDKYKFKVVREV